MVALFLRPQHPRSRLRVGTVASGPPPPPHIRTAPPLEHTQVVSKAGQAVPKNAVVRINAEDPKYVCRAGFKLEKALDHFGINVTGVTALDAGLSTGGFTDCLLQRGARHVRIRGWVLLHQQQ